MDIGGEDMSVIKKTNCVRARSVEYMGTPIEVPQVVQVDSEMEEAQTAAKKPPVTSFYDDAFECSKIIHDSKDELTQKLALRLFRALMLLFEMAKGCGNDEVAETADYLQKMSFLERELMGFGFSHNVGHLIAAYKVKDLTISTKLGKKRAKAVDAQVREAHCKMLVAAASSAEDYRRVLEMVKPADTDGLEETKLECIYGIETALAGEAYSVGDMDAVLKHGNLALKAISELTDRTGSDRFRTRRDELQEVIWGLESKANDPDDGVEVG